MLSSIKKAHVSSVVRTDWITLQTCSFQFLQLQQLDHAASIRFERTIFQKKKIQTGTTFQTKAVIERFFLQNFGP